jgi:Ca2+-binding RTX toxin-like protein
VRRAASLAFLVLAVALVLGGGLAVAATRTGTNGGETLFGTPYADTIHAYGGDDLVHALGGNDRLYGGKGSDRLYGGYGSDHIVSRDLNSKGIGQRDVVDCGPGYDTFAVDYDDRVLANCEEGSASGF